MTVNGPIQKEKLGVTSPHEHALLDIRNQYVGARDDKSIGWNERVCKLNLEALRNDPYLLVSRRLLKSFAKRDALSASWALSVWTPCPRRWSTAFAALSAQNSLI